MKIIYNIVLLVLVLNFSVKSIAQNAATYYDTCHALRQFEGEWRNISGQDTIKLYLRVNNFYSQPNNFVGGEIIGWQEYKVGNNVIQSDYSHRFDVMPTNFSQKGQIISSIGLASGIRGSDCDGVLSNLYGAIRDFNKNSRYQRWIVTRISATTIQVQQVQGECYSTSTSPCLNGFTLPQTFLLTKQ